MSETFITEVHLSCDYPYCHADQFDYKATAVFFDWNKARIAGWIKHGSKVYCPAHNKPKNRK